MIYLSREDVEVEDAGEGWVRVTVEKTFDPKQHTYTDAEARAVVEGLLRRMLERDGVQAFHEFTWGVEMDFRLEKAR